MSGAVGADGHDLGPEGRVGRGVEQRLEVGAARPRRGRRAGRAVSVRASEGRHHPSLPRVPQPQGAARWR